MRYYFLITILAVALTACDSGSNATEEIELTNVNGSWMTATIDGNVWRNTLEVTASILPVPGTETRIFVITGAGNGENILTAQAFVLSKVIPGEGETVEPDQEKSIAFATDTVTQEEENVYTADGADVDVQITEITDTVVRGTFSGRLTDEDDTSRMISITDGEFVANIQ